MSTSMSSTPKDESSKQNDLSQEASQDEIQFLPAYIANTNKAVGERITPHYPNWPTSRPGPLASQPGVGQRPINALRPEQMAEAGYNQETGTPRKQDPERYWPDEDLKGRTGFDQLGTAQEQKQRGDDPTHPWSRHT